MAIYIKKKIKQNAKIIIIVFLFITLVMVFIIRPLSKEKREFSIEDRCGPFMGSIVHTIKNEDVCEMRCRSQCEVNNFNYRKIIYEDGGIGCNSCTCLCVR